MWIFNNLAIFDICMCLMGASTNYFWILLLNRIFWQNYFSKIFAKIYELEMMHVEFAYQQKYWKLAKFAYIGIARGKNLIFEFLDCFLTTHLFSRVDITFLPWLMLIFPYISAYHCTFIYHLSDFRHSHKIRISWKAH